MSGQDLDEHEHVVAAVEDVPPGTARRVEVDGRALAIVNVEGTFYALSDSCPHKEGRFSLVGQETFGRGGTLGELDADECTIKCPYHYWEFDLVSGRSTTGQKKRVPTFDSRVVDGEVRVRLR